MNAFSNKILQFEVCTSSYPATHWEGNFHDPETFKPERWLEEGSRDQKDASRPFLTGPRNCLGMK
jgi:cytochrome P450